VLDEWAYEFGIPYHALMALKLRIGVRMAQATPPLDKPNDEDAALSASEARQQSLIRLAAAEMGIWLTRNNVGALLDKTGRPVRYGWANESKEQNKHAKSADLMGIHTITITPADVGRKIGQLVSVECKEEGWCYTGTEREVAQLNWANFVNAKGGKAFFANSPEQFRQQVMQWQAK
jgi:hypothetical protein